MKALIIILLTFAVAYMLGNWLKHKPDNAANIHYSNCDIALQLCKQDIEGGHYEVSFSARPSALTPFDVVARFEGKQPEAMSISFEMEGMDMGFNEHPLKLDDEQWKASVILPVCALGRNDWKAKLFYTVDGKSHVTQFSFKQQ